MRIHTNNLTEADIQDAARIAGAYIESFSEHRSRTHARAYNVLLTGLSRRRPNGGSSGAGDDYAATWDQWGVFLGYLYSVDEYLKNPYYSDGGDFDYKTDWRFDLDFDYPIPFSLSHDHHWVFAGTPREFECKCGAVKRGTV